MKRNTKEQFIERAQAVHGDKYDYSSVNYTKNNVPVSIGCFEHGTFEQRPDNHLVGQGCPKCFIDRVSVGQEEWIKKAKTVHSGKPYDFSETIYSGCTSRLKVNCTLHGKFEFRADSILKGAGCPDCKKPFGNQLGRI